LSILNGFGAKKQGVQERRDPGRGKGSQQKTLKTSVKKGGGKFP